MFPDKYVSIIQSASLTSNKDKITWTEKYRPQNIDEVVSHDEIVQSLKKCLENKMFPHMLFNGPSGSGKTSTIKCCAQHLYGEYANIMTLELNASNDRGIDIVRTKIKNFVTNRISAFLPIENQNIFKLVILDEIDSMTIEAQGMLRQTIEKNSKTTRFCLICNDIDKIDVALQSRCAVYRFSPLLTEMKERLIEICDTESVKYTKESIKAIMKISKGDMRASINILQQVSLITNNNITLDNIYKVTGYCKPDIIITIFNTLLDLTSNKINIKKCTDTISRIIIENNITFFYLLNELKHNIIDHKYTTDQKIYLITNLAKVEVYDSVGIDTYNLIMTLSSIFIMVRKI